MKPLDYDEKIGMRIAQRLLSVLLDRPHERGITGRELSDLIGSALGQWGQGSGDFLNCYPGKEGHGCYDLAVFVSLSSPSYIRGNDHLSFKKALEKIVQHMQGSCSGESTHAILITDSWSASDLEKWKANLLQIQNTSCLEIFLLAGSHISPLSL